MYLGKRATNGDDCCVVCSDVSCYVGSVGSIVGCHAAEVLAGPSVQPVLLSPSAASGWVRYERVDDAGDAEMLVDPSFHVQLDDYPGLGRN